MNDNSHPAGKISVHGNGVGTPSPDEVEKRAREIALIAERDPDEFTDADWDQARRELLGTQASGVAVACPFCVTMFEDGVRALNVEERFAVRDIAEIVAEAL